MATSIATFQAIIKKSVFKPIFAGYAKTCFNIVVVKVKTIF